jgi:hypothetical protein
MAHVGGNYSGDYPSQRDRAKSSPVPAELAFVVLEVCGDRHFLHAKSPVLRHISPLTRRKFSLSLVVLRTTGVEAKSGRRFWWSRSDWEGAGQQRKIEAALDS